MKLSRKQLRKLINEVVIVADFDPEAIYDADKDNDKTPTQDVILVKAKSHAEDSAKLAAEGFAEPKGYIYAFDSTTVDPLSSNPTYYFKFKKK